MCINLIITDAQSPKGATQTGSLFWTAAGSEAPRRFRTHGPLGLFSARRSRKSGVAAALCHRSPRHIRRDAYSKN
jgi:hypothetical protein